MNREDNRSNMPVVSHQNRLIKDVSAKVERLAMPYVMRSLPKALGLRPKRFMQTVLQALTTTPRLAECELTSIVLSVLRAAQYGIECDGVQGALVPYKGTCQFIPMFQGLMSCVMRSGAVSSMQPPRAVFEGDDFEYTYGLNETLRHVPADDWDNQTWDKLRYVYCVAKFKSGEQAFVVLPRSYVETIRRRSAAQKGPWLTDPIPMAMKTAVRNLCKYLPKSAEDSMLARLVDDDELVDAGMPEKIQVDGELAAMVNAEKPTQQQRLAAKLAATLPVENADDAPAVQGAPTPAQEAAGTSQDEDAPWDSDEPMPPLPPPVEPPTADPERADPTMKPPPLARKGAARRPPRPSKLFEADEEAMNEVHD